MKLLISFIVFLFSATAIFATSPADYSFIVASHIYGTPNQGKLGLYSKFVDSLKQNINTNTSFLILNGDIIWGDNIPQAWQQVQTQLDEFNLPYYFVLGNHDNSEHSRNLLTEKYGDTYYSFTYGKELFIILNSQKSFLSISEDQLEFLEKTLNQSQQTTIFIFFSELLWNGNNPDYKGIKTNTNSRSNYSLMTRSNYWSEVDPILQQFPEKTIYVFAGDIGGQADSIPAFYQNLGSITLIASGMGAIQDENYLQVDITDQEVNFKLIPLNSKNTLKSLEYYTPENLTKVTPESIKKAIPRYIEALFYIAKTRNFHFGLLVGTIIF